MTDESNGAELPQAEGRLLELSWEALEDAFENNAPEVHSYLNLLTGEVLRVVDGVADPAMHQRIAGDADYLRVDPVSSREQYRWMERFIAIVTEPDLRARLVASIDGKGAFRRFKDVLMAFPVEREKWFEFRTERLRSCMDGWLEAHKIRATPRPAWVAPEPESPDGSVDPTSEALRRARAGVESLRRRLHDVVDLVPPREIETAIAFLEFLSERRHDALARSTEFPEE
ncbi:MAG: UPF0158 family protein [Deltaproteobacteria bacterium]|nr:UPF0158 family protein [Deltaproteobacteria bacterium]